MTKETKNKWLIPVRFKDAEEMLSSIQSGEDLYNKETEQYVFLYNGAGSIAVYDIEEQEADALIASSHAAGGEYWGAFLGVGGNIYDDPSYEYYSDEIPSNLDYCKENYDKGQWFTINYAGVMMDNNENNEANAEKEN